VPIKTAALSTFTSVTTDLGKQIFIFAPITFLQISQSNDLVRFRFDFGSISVRFRFGFCSIFVRFLFDFGSVFVRFWFGFGSVLVRWNVCFFRGNIASSSTGKMKPPYRTGSACSACPNNCDSDLCSKCTSHPHPPLPLALVLCFCLYE
jgi:hypothetical protein